MQLFIIYTTELVNSLNLFSHALIILCEAGNFTAKKYLLCSYGDF